MIELKNSKLTYLGKAKEGKNKFALDCHIGAVQMREDGRDWEDIDPTLDGNGLPKKVPYELTPYLTGMPGFHFKSKLSGEFDVRLKSGRTPTIKGKTLDIQPIVPLPKIEGSQITWEDIYPDTNVVLACHNTGVSLRRILKSDEAPTEYDVTVSEVIKGTAQLLPLQPAIDAIGQPIEMTEKPIAGGRTETLIKQIITKPEEIAKPIVYPITDSTEVEVQVGNTANDGRRYTGSSGFSTTDTGQFVGYYGSAAFYNCHYFARWEGVTISGTIDVSYVQIRGRDTPSGTPQLKVYGVDEDNPAAPTSAAEFDADALTTAAVDWDGAWAKDTWVESPSLNSIFQELVDTYTISNDAIMVQIKNDGGTTSRFNYPMDYSFNSAYAPIIHIEYTESGGGGLSIPVAMHHYKMMRR